MLKENPAITDSNRRWFSDDYFDLVVWYDEAGSVSGFQLCYDKQGTERALTWLRDEGVDHRKIDSGEDSPLKNMSPVLIPDGAIPYDMLLRQFRTRANALDSAIAGLIENKLQEGLGGQFP
jgi:hypothetical protein